MNITVEGGKSKKLLTGGKYCPNDIVVTAELEVLSRLLEVVETFTPAEDVMTHDFYFPKAGGYMIVSDPPASPEMAISLGKTLPEAGFLRINSPTESSSSFNDQASPANFWNYDGKPSWWRTIITNVSENVFSVSILADKQPYRAGFTYYLLRCNW